MSLPVTYPQKVWFGDFVIDLKTGELARNGYKFILQGQPFQILAILLERPDELVSREELKKRLWPSDTFVDFDHSLNKAVNRLREALADSAEEPRYVETLPRRGYRFIAEVRHNGARDSFSRTSSSDSPSSAYVSDPMTPDVPLSTLIVRSAPARWLWKRWLFATVASVVILLSGAVLILRHRVPKTRPLSYENLEIARLTNNGRVHNVAISPDG